MKNHHKLVSIIGTPLLVGPLMLAQGCLATRDWVKEQMDPVSARLSQSETNIGEARGQISTLTGRLTGVEGNVSQIDGKAERALSGLANLRLERKLVIDFKDGANFAFDKAVLSPDAKKEIDSFMSDAKGDVASSDGTIYVVAGHTDNVGPQEYNYALGHKRAEGVARYLMSQKNIDPVRIVTVSYGKDNPLADNSTQQGRAKNRRVEIMVYRDGISSTPTTAAATPRAASERAQPADETLSRR